MTPRAFSDELLREVPVLSRDQTVRSAVRAIGMAGVPALPVVDARAAFTGIFGEREFIEALFPGYLGTLRHAGFVPHSLDVAIERRASSLEDPVGHYANRDRIAVTTEYSDAELAETFLHHRVLIVPVLDAQRRVLGVVTRTDFFTALASRLR
jgi:CBS-domain-containing membrane protein